MNEAAAAVLRLANDKGDPWRAIEEIVDVESVVLSLKDELGTPGTWDGIRSAKEDKLREIVELAEKEKTCPRCGTFDVPLGAYPGFGLVNEMVCEPCWNALKKGAMPSAK